MDKIDFQKRDRAFYSGKVGRWDQIDLPAMTFLAMEGQGDPNGPEFSKAVAALYPLAYGLKFARKAQGADFAVPPLEGLWWADDHSAFVSCQRGVWRWRAQLRVPDEVSADALETIRTSALKKLAAKSDAATTPDVMARVSLVREVEGPCLQTLHLGPFADETPVLDRLHREVMPGLGLTFAGHHHEIYLSDPRRSTPEKLRTVLRQPVRPF
jgi:hypothetical protein